MIDISERITRKTMSSDPNSPLRAEGTRAPPGVRATLEFNRSVPLTPGQEVRLRYDLTGDGHFLDCVGIPQLTHTVARLGQPVVIHYRLSHWITPATLSRLRWRTSDRAAENRRSESSHGSPATQVRSQQSIGFPLDYRIALAGQML
jgi:hypothetical protein